MGNKFNDFFSGLFSQDTPDPPTLPDEEELDEEEAEARRREAERIRLAAGSNQTRLSGSVSQALNAPIGKRTLGGTV